MPSKRALEIISRFDPIASRPAMKEMLGRCMLIAFKRYAQELEQVQKIYERNKVCCTSCSMCRKLVKELVHLQSCPELCRNAPPVSQAVQWARQLLMRVEEPMKAFKSNNTVMQSVVSACSILIKVQRDERVGGREDWERKRGRR